MALELDITPKVEGSGGSGILDIGTIFKTTPFIVQGASTHYYYLDTIPNLQNKKMIVLTYNSSSNTNMLAILIRNDITQNLEIEMDFIDFSLTIRENIVLDLMYDVGDLTYYAI